MARHSTTPAGPPASGGVGFERSIGFETFIGIDVQNQMYSRNSTCYIRIPFTVAAADLASLTGLSLNIRYDDGFVIYLNGAEIIRKNFTGDPTWNSRANTQNPDPAAIRVRALRRHDTCSTNCGGPKHPCRPGNESAPTTSSDFLFSMELVSTKAPAAGTPIGISPTAVRYTEPDHAEQERARQSPLSQRRRLERLNEAVFSVGPVAESLRISEIMYHPVGEPGCGDFELTNIGDQPDPY